MKMHRFAFSLFSVFIALSSYAEESALWRQFLDAKATGSEPTLPDFSYAGYDYSESPLPDTSRWTIFDVRDFGAVADDEGFDDVAREADAAVSDDWNAGTFDGSRSFINGR